MYELWTTVNEADGVRKYGRAFHNIMYLLKFHHFNAADRKTDHIHNGNGIIMQHIKFTNIFEASLQSILPALALPYWDFTVDAASNLRINESFAMNPSMFGGLTRPKVFTQGFTAEHDRIASGAIPSGRWANFLSDFNEDFPDMQFGYGYMRAPWNLNPSPFVSRFTFNFSTYKLPSCSDHFNLLNFNNMMTFFDLGEFAPHGNMHILQVFIALPTSLHFLPVAPSISYPYSPNPFSPPPSLLPLPSSFPRAAPTAATTSNL